MRRLVAGLVLIAIALPCFFATALLGQQKPTFRSGVEIVLLDVNVIGESHSPVSDLRPDEFVVSVDRKERKVVSAQFVRYDVRTSATTDRQPVSVAPSAAAKPAERPSARNVLIVIDTDSMEPGDGLLVRQEAAAFIDRLAPDDRAGVVTVPRMQSAVTMTKIREEAKAELAKVITSSERHRSLQFNIGLAEAFDVERGYADIAAKVVMRECNPGYPGCGHDVQMEIRQMHIQARMRAQRSLDALRELGESLARIDGPKTLVYVTGGAPMPDLKSATAYSQMGTAFAAAQISLYTLYVHQEQLHQVRYRQSPTASQDMALDREGTENTTGAANGTMMEVVGTYDQYFDRILTELSGSYLIGVEVQPSDRDGRPHHLSVKVNRKGVEVRARKQYVIEVAGKRASGSNVSAAEVAATVPRAPAPVSPPNPARDLAATPAELQPLVARMQQYAQGYERAFLALLSEERSELRLSKWEVSDGRGTWTVARQRRIAAENLVVKRSAGPGWGVARDVFEVDGQVLRPRDGRLRALFLEVPDEIVQRAATMTTAASAHDIGFVDRSMNIAIGPLVFLTAGGEGHFVFAKQGEQVVAGTSASQIAFAERGEPAFASGRAGRVPVSGALWVDPGSGAILKTVVRWEADGSAVEITVTYGRATDGTMWVPAEMVETYTAGSERLECSTRFSSYRRFDAS